MSIHIVSYIVFQELKRLSSEHNDKLSLGSSVCKVLWLDHFLITDHTSQKYKCMVSYAEMNYCFISLST